MAIASFTDLFLELQKLGILDSLIPFILIFTIVFSTLEKTQILGIAKKGMNTIVALAIGLLVVIPHIIGAYPPGKDVVEIMNTFIPNISLVAIAVLMALILAGVFGFQFIGGQMTGAVLIFSAIVVIYYLGQAMGWWHVLLPGLSSETKALIIAILIFGLIIWFITRDDNKGNNVFGWYKGLNDALKRPGQ